MTSHRYLRAGRPGGRSEAPIRDRKLTGRVRGPDVVVWRDENGGGDAATPTDGDRRVGVASAWYAFAMSDQAPNDSGSGKGDDERDDQRHEMRQAWSDVGDRFGALSDAVRRRGTGSEPTGDAGRGGDSGALRAAFDKVMDAVRDLGDQASTVVKDPDVRAHTRDVAQSLNAALSATVDRIGGEVDALARKAKRSDRATGSGDGSARDT
jgi:hypothetical protein